MFECDIFLISWVFCCGSINVLICTLGLSFSSFSSISYSFLVLYLFLHFLDSIIRFFHDTSTKMALLSLMCSMICLYYNTSLPLSVHCKYALGPQMLTLGICRPRVFIDVLHLASRDSDTSLSYKSQTTTN